MQNLYDPHCSILGQILQQEIRTKQLVNEHALIPINDYLQKHIFPYSEHKPIQTYLDIASGTGILSAKIKDLLHGNGHPATMFTLDLFSKVAEPGSHVQANAIQLPFRQHSFDFITMNFGFRYFTSMPKKQIAGIESELLEETAKNYGFDKTPILYNEFMSKAFFLHDILYRVLKSSGRFMLLISTESPDIPLNICYSSLSMIIDCFLAETSPLAAIRRFWRIANPTSFTFFKALYQSDCATKHAENHFFNTPLVTQALLQHFHGRMISVNATTSMGILEFTALQEDRPQTSIHEEIDEEIDVEYLEYALPV